MSLLILDDSLEEWVDGSAVGVLGPSFPPSLLSLGYSHYRCLKGIFADQWGDFNKGTRKAALRDIFTHDLQGSSAWTSP